MTKHYQIIVKNGPDGKWQFYAHGARLYLEDSLRIIEQFKERGIPARKLLV